MLYHQLLSVVGSAFFHLTESRKIVKSMKLGLRADLFARILYVSDRNLTKIVVVFIGAVTAVVDFVAESPARNAFEIVAAKFLIRWTVD
jgi:hypothetical protein